jgi:simple sugar transport system ATP-binding protein
MIGITKRFPGVLANDHIDFEARRGEVHALLGENGAGKSTLMNILYGLYRPDEGEIWIEGRRVQIRSPRDAIKLGVGMVHQHLMLVPNHTVIENVALGLKLGRILLPEREIRSRLAQLSGRYGLPVDPDARIWQLSMGERQRVELLRILLWDVKILILDEPTSVLTPQEAQQLFRVLRAMAQEGRTVIFISHKLDEVLEVSDRITVLRRGRVIATVRSDETTKEELARMMVGRPLLAELPRRQVSQGEVVLEVQGLKVRGDRGLLALEGVSFRVHRNEVFGIAGVAGNGQRELAEAVVGLRQVEAGTVRLLGRDITNRNPSEIMRIGVAVIPEERLGVGVIPTLTVAENFLLRYNGQPSLIRLGFLNRKALREYAARLVERFRVITPSIDSEAGKLSGGNLQRLILARELSKGASLIVAVHPTSGLDVGATEFVHRALIEARDRGAAILLISEDLDEVLSVSDRIGVIYRGRLMGVLDAKTAKIDEVGLMMAGTPIEKVSES